MASEGVTSSSSGEHCKEIERKDSSPLRLALKRYIEEFPSIKQPRQEQQRPQKDDL